MTTEKTRKAVLWRMPCPWCAQKKACMIMEDTRHNLYARCSFDCGISFAEVGIVRWVRQSQPQDIEPISWKADRIAAYLKAHPAF